MARRVKLSEARKAVDSTLRRILNYTAEIILSIILLVIICIPLAFVIPMWFQHIALGLPRPELALDPVHWFGLDGAVWLTLLLGLVSFVIGYAFILRLKPGTISADEPEEEEPEPEEEDEEIEEEPEEEVEELSEEEEEESTSNEEPEEDE
jgi:hypothetical protein